MPTPYMRQSTPESVAEALEIYELICDTIEDREGNILLVVIERIAAEILDLVVPEAREQITDIFCRRVKERVQLGRIN